MSGHAPDSKLVRATDRPIGRATDIAGRSPPPILWAVRPLGRIGCADGEDEGRLGHRRENRRAGEAAARSRPDLGPGRLMGLFFKPTKPTDDLAADGVRCRATVEHADMLGRGSSQFNLSSAKAESILSGEVSPLRYKVRLRVEPQVGEPYVVRTKVSAPVMKA